MNEPIHDPIFCPIHATLNLLSARWTLHIVRALLGGTRRFNELSRELGVNPRTLSSRLRALEKEGVIQRTMICEKPPAVEYSLTDKGRALNCVMEDLAAWGRDWVQLPAGV